MATMRIYRQMLPEAWGSSILEGESRPWSDPEKEKLYLERETDEQGRELFWALFSEDGSVHSRRRTEYDPSGNKLSFTEYFSETESEVVHRFTRRAEGDVTVERESLEYSGELDSIIERRFGADGTLLSERELDADGQPFDDGEPEEGDEAAEDEAGEDEEIEDSFPGAVEEKDDKGRVIKSVSSTDRHGIVYVQTAVFSYEGDSEKPAMMRLDRVAIIDPDAPPRPLSSGFRQSRYDAQGRPSEILLADMVEGDLEADAYYRIEYGE